MRRNMPKALAIVSMWTAAMVTMTMLRAVQGRRAVLPLGLGMTTSQIVTVIATPMTKTMVVIITTMRILIEVKVKVILLQVLVVVVAAALAAMATALAPRTIV
jgi:hypothetical protein